MRYNKLKYLYDLFEDGEHLLDETPRVGWVNFFQPKPGGLGLRHRQSKVHEIYCVVGGVLRMLIDGRTVEALAGEALIIKPGVVHSGTGPLSTIEPCELYWFELQVPKLARCPGMSAQHKQELLRDLAALRLQKFPLCDETQSRFRQLVNEHRQPDGSVLAARLTLCSLLVNLLRDHARAVELRSEQVRHRASGIQRALADMDAGKPVSIAELAHQAHLRVPQYYRLFREETGTTPLEYRLRRRIQIAAEMIVNSDATVADIAVKLGFSSSQYFATVFKRFTDLTPTEYRRQMSAPTRGK